MTTLINQNNQIHSLNYINQDIAIEDLENRMDTIQSQKSQRRETLNTQKYNSENDFKLEGTKEQTQNKKFFDSRRRFSSKIDSTKSTCEIPSNNDINRNSISSPIQVHDDGQKNLKPSPNMVCQQQQEGFQQVHSLQLENEGQKKVESGQNQDLEEQMTCRLCLDSECNQETGKLENVCNCNGSLKYIHRQCLWLQIENKINKMDKVTLPVQVSCELCKKEYRIGFSLVSKLNTFQVFKENITRQVRPYLSFFLFAFLSVIVSGVLFQKIDSNQKADYYVLIIYFFFSFALTSAMISLIFLIYFLISSIYYKTLIIQKIFPDNASYENYKLVLQKQMNRQNKSSVHPESEKPQIDENEEIQVEDMV